MLQLINSFETLLKKVIANKSIWARSISGGWYHTFDKNLVNDRISKLKDEILRLRAVSS